MNACPNPYIPDRASLPGVRSRISLWGSIVAAAFSSSSVRMASAVSCASNARAFSDSGDSEAFPSVLKYRRLSARCVSALIAVKTSLSGCLPASAFVIVVAKFGSLPSAAASSFRVSRTSGDEPTSAASSLRTNAAFAASRPAASSGGVGVVGVPVKAGLSSGAFVFVSSMTALTAFGVAASSSLSLSVSLHSCTRPFSVVLAFVAFRSSTICCASSLYCFASCALSAPASWLSLACRAYSAALFSCPSAAFAAFSALVAADDAAL
ncbi:hypothetical protein BvCms12BK_02376 [Escherichia coli]|nr:hypothetical protein BvCms12BK_02376 [Escherichia coli]